MPLGSKSPRNSLFRIGSRCCDPKGPKQRPSAPPEHVKGQDQVLGEQRAEDEGMEHQEDEEAPKRQSKVELKSGMDMLIFMRRG